MFKSLFLLHQGSLTSQNFIEEQKTKRALNLQLSKHQDIEHTFSAGINHLSLDDNENRYLLSGCADGSLFIHDLFNFSNVYYYTAKCVAKVSSKSTHAHAKSVECATWFPSDNGLFVSSGGDKKLKVWDTNLLKPIDIIDSKGRVNHHECSPSTRSLIAVANHTNLVELIDLRTGNRSHELRGHKGSIMAVAWSPRTGYLLASGGMDGETKLWDVRSSAGHLNNLSWHGSGTAHMGLVNGLSFTPDGLHLITLGTDKHLRLWNPEVGRALPTNYGRVKNDAWRHVQMAISDFVFVPSKGLVHILNLWTGESVGSLCGHFNRVTCCVLRQPYQELYSGGNDRNVLVWSAEDPLCIIPWEGRFQTGDQWSSDSDSEGGRENAEDS